MVGNITTDNEPTPEFNARCMDVINRWQNGTLPYQEAVATLTHYLQEADDNPVNQGRVEQLLGFIQHYRGNFTTSIRHVERARELYEKVGNLRRVAIMDLNQGENYRFLGDFKRAVQLFRNAQQILQDYNQPRDLTLAIVNEGLVLVTLGRDEEAKQVFERAIAISQALPEDIYVQRMMCEVYQGMAQIYLRAGHPQAAWENATQAIELAQYTGDAILCGMANRIMGEVITELGGVPDEQYTDDPDFYFRASLNALQEIDAEAEQARTMFSQAVSLAKRGKRTTAARKLEHVMAIFTQLGMRDDAARAAEVQRHIIA
ncbi:MAG: hypothetical protein Kow00117_19680 [Phototrophicales bacterium]